jgi:hypothetical protein
MSPPVYRAVACHIYPFDRDCAVVSSPELDCLTHLEMTAARALAACAGARTLEAHVDAIAAGGTAADQSGVRSILDDLVSGGLLRRVDGCVGARSEADAPPPGITTVGIITADRPSAFRRCLSSLLTNCETHSRHPRILVVDGSREEGNRQRNIDTVSAVVHGIDSHVEYVGHREAAAIRARLAQTGVDASSLQAALSPGTAGTNRNLLLLLTAGEQIMSLDDDMVCEPWSLLERDDRVVVGGHGDHREWRFFDARSDAIAATVPASVDLLTCHELLLGRTVSWLLQNADGGVDMRTACPHLLASLAKRQSLVVRMTFPGLAGDSGIYCPHRLLLGSGDVQERLMASQEICIKAMTRREVIRINKRNTVTHDPSCMAGCMGLSNIGIPPPFMPLGRNQDGVFGVMLAFAEPRAVFGHLSYGVIHDSDRGPNYTTQMLSATETRLSDLILALIRRGAASLATAPVDRLRSLAVVFHNLGRMDEREFLGFARESVLESRLREFTHVAQATPLEASCPPHWQNAVDRYRSAFLESTKGADFAIPVEWGQALMREERVRKTQAFLSEFSRIIEAWPELWEASPAISEIPVRLGRLD